MLKKLASMLLALLLCLSAFPGLAHAEDIPPKDDPPVIIEPLDPEEPAMPAAAPSRPDVPIKDDDAH